MVGSSIHGHPTAISPTASLFSSAREFALDVHEHQRQGRGSRALPQPHAGDGGRFDPPQVHGQGVAATSAAGSGLTRSGPEKATERGWHGPISLPDRRAKAIPESCTGPKYPYRVRTSSEGPECAERRTQIGFACQVAHIRRCSTDVGDRIIHGAGHQEGVRFSSSAACGTVERSARSSPSTKQLPNSLPFWLP